MDIYMLTLRTIHIFAGVLWVGAAVFYLFLVSPTVKSIGAAGGQFMHHFVTRKRYPQYMSVVAILTIVSGLLLFAKVSGGLQLGWLKTGSGLVLTIGSVVGVLVAPLGFLMIRPRAEKLGVLGQALVTAGGPPSPAQLAELHTLDRELNIFERLDFLMLTVAVLAMAVARYLY